MISSRRFGIYLSVVALLCLSSTTTAASSSGLRTRGSSEKRTRGSSEKRTRGSSEKRTTTASSSSSKKKTTTPRIKIIDFDSDTITHPVLIKTSTPFSPTTPTVTSETSPSYVGPPIHGALVTSSSHDGRWSATNQVNSGLRLHWGKGKGEPGETLSGLFLFGKAGFINDMSYQSVAMDRSSTVNVMINEVTPGAIESCRLHFVVADNSGYYISAPFLYDDLVPNMPLTFHPLSLEYSNYNAIDNADSEVGKTGGPGRPSFQDIHYVGVRLDARRGQDTFKPGDLGVKVFTVGAAHPDEVAKKAMAVDTRKKTRISLKGHQSMEGFGATVAFEISSLEENEHAEELMQLLFKDLNIDLLRIRNCYMSSDTSNPYETDITDTVSLVKKAEDVLGREIKIIITSWTAPDDLKTSSGPRGGTIAYDPENIMDYHYREYAIWWMDSMQHYHSLGIVPEFIIIQNEPDVDTPDASSMRLEPSQLKDNAVAGYNMAIEAVIQYMQVHQMNDIPLVVGPDTSGFDNRHPDDDVPLSLQTYIDNLVFSRTFHAWSHHIYEGDIGTNPDALNESMEHFAHLNHKPKFITAYHDTSSTTGWLRFWNYAKVVHNALTQEGVSAFMHKSLYGSGDDALIRLPDDTSFEVTPEYYALMHYSKFISWEVTRVEATTEEEGVFLSAFADEPNGKLIVIVLNENDEKVNLTVEFEEMSVMGGEVYRSTEDKPTCAKVGEYDPTSEDKGVFGVAGRSVTTFYLDFMSPYGVIRDDVVMMQALGGF